MNTQAIGVFDSGFGGLSVLRELRRALPSADFVYVADAGFCPYGGRQPEVIVQRARVVTEFLMQQGAGLIVVACNAATVAAVETLRTTYPIGFVGMEPAVKPAAALSRSKVIGVLTTVLTARGQRLQQLVERHADGVRVLVQPCPGLVEKVEVGEIDGSRTRALVARYVEPLVAAGADTVVLGCTHYPFLRPLIAEAAGPGVQLLDTAEAVARRATALAGGAAPGPPAAGHRFAGSAAGAAGGRLRWFTSGSVETMERVGARLWGAPIHAEALPR